MIMKELADLAKAARWENLPARVQKHVKLVLLDTLGAVIAGLELKEIRSLYQLGKVLGRAGSCTVPGLGRELSAPWAALINGTAGCALELDEGHRFAGGHPAVHVVPAALAAAEEGAASGRRLLEAVAAGYEVAARIGMASRLRPGVHPHGTWGTPGAAVAVALVKGERNILSCLNLSSSLVPAASFQSALSGARVRNLYPGVSAFISFLTYSLRGCGFEGEQEAVQEVFGRILGAEFDNGALPFQPGWWAVEQNYFKMYSCCRHINGAVDALKEIMRREELKPEEVELIEVYTYAAAASLGRTKPVNALAARFSFPAVIATAVVHGPGRIEEPEWFGSYDRAAAELAERVKVVEEPEFSAALPVKRPVKVVVYLRSGTRLAHTINLPSGEREHPWGRERLYQKFFRLASRVLGKNKCAEVVRCIEGLDNLSDIRELTELLV